VRGAISTERLDVTVATTEVVEALLAGPSAAEAALGTRLAEGWLDDPDVQDGLRIHLVHLRRDPSEAPWRVRLITLRTERLVVGSVNMKGPPGPDGTADIGWGVSPAYRGHGIAREAARALLSWALGQPGVRRVTARIQPTNTPSIRLARHLGMDPTPEWHPGQGRIWETRKGGGP